MALNAAQIAARAGKLTGSRIACLMTGDEPKINQLWLEMTDQALPEDLSDVWPVQLGACTEQLQLDWYERKQRQAVSRRGDVVNHPFLAWAAVTLDGWIDEMQCPIEVKHVGGREPLEVIEARYAPQLQWQMECTGASQIAMSVIMGASEPIVEFYQRNADYADTLIARGAQFMQHVRDRTPPVDLPAVPAPIDAHAVYDMQGDNTWALHAGRWLELRDSAEAYDEAAKILKSIVPPDAKKCFGYGVQITRDRRGYLSLRLSSEEQ